MILAILARRKDVLLELILAPKRDPKIAQISTKNRPRVDIASKGPQEVYFEPLRLKEPRKNTMFLHAPMQKPS